MLALLIFLCYTANWYRKIGNILLSSMTSCGTQYFLTPWSADIISNANIIKLYEYKPHITTINKALLGFDHLGYSFNSCSFWIKGNECILNSPQNSTANHKQQINNGVKQKYKAHIQALNKCKRCILILNESFTTKRG